jgi:hypothetical protein
MPCRSRSVVGRNNLNVVGKSKHGHIVRKFPTSSNLICSLLRRISVKKDRFKASFERMHIGVGVKGFGGRDYGVVIAESSRGSDRGYHYKLANVPVFA